MNTVVDTLHFMSQAPIEPERFDAWLKFDDAIAFLRENTRQNEFVLYAALPSTFIHAVTVPNSSVETPDAEDLLSWHCNPHSSWGVSISNLAKTPLVSLCPPLEHTGSKTLDRGEQLVFARSFDGHIGEHHYYEILQKFTHIFDLHFSSERRAYSRLDKHGDVEDVVRIAGPAAREEDRGWTVISVKRGVLDEYLALTDSAVARTFDFTRYKSGSFAGWSDRQDVKRVNEETLFYRSHIEPGHASYMRGCQIVRASHPRELLLRRFYSPEEQEEPKQYASFVAYDWRNRLVREISCAPGETDNYFTDSQLPFELSPAFFKPAVLLKYKADSEKYRLEDRSITCRNSWQLQTYDVNDAGQVHTYIVYLRDLPHSEQLYWKSFNEEPKAPISKRAAKTDFAGEWDFEYEPLESLRKGVSDLNSQKPGWWIPRPEKALNHLHYPLTEGADEWSEEIFNLDQAVVEGFRGKWFKQRLASLGEVPDPKFVSLKLLEEYLVRLGCAEDDAREIVGPLKRTQYLRTKLKGHTPGSEAKAIRAEAIKSFGSLKNHFRELCVDCDNSLRTIKTTLAQA